MADDPHPSDSRPDTADTFVDWATTWPSPTPPPPATVQWIEDQVSDRVEACIPLPGGLSSAVHRVELAQHDPVILRRYTLAEWLEREPYVPHDEMRNLAILGELDLRVPTPLLVAADPDGARCDVPALLMTEVAGAPEIDPADAGSWADRLAECLAGIHAQPVIEGLPEYARWDHPDRPVPTWTQSAELWVDAIAASRQELPPHPRVFLHRDFHPNNVHWRDGEICGVVDWLGACNGPIAGDLAHCRWNLAILQSSDMADRFTDRYRELTGYSEDVSFFDLSTVLSGPVGPFPTHAWNDLGRKDLTSDTVGVRIDGWLERILQQRS